PSQIRGRLRPRLARSVGLGPVLSPPYTARMDQLSTTAPRPINLVAASEPIQQRKVDQIPHARQLPIAQAPPARHPRSALEFLREHLPRNAGAKDENDAGQARAIRNLRPPTFSLSR